MQNWPSSLLLNLFLICLVAICAPSCSCDGDEDDDSGPSITDDDSSADDDVADDDDADDDSVDDDSADDDDEFPSLYPPDGGQWFGDLFIRQIAGGEPGLNGTSSNIGSDGTKYLVADKGGILFLYTGTPTNEWTREKIDYFGVQAKSKLDADDHLHMVYYDDWNDSIKYATNRNGSWEIETIALAQQYQTNINSDIALDTQGFDHICYYDLLGNSFKYVTNKSGDWVFETISPGFGGVDPSIAIDGDGFAHLSYTRFPLYDWWLSYATNRSGSWVSEDFFNSWWEVPSKIAVDSAGFVHIGCARSVSMFFSTDINYTTNKSGQWVTTTLANGDYLPGPELAIDDRDGIHMAWQANRLTYGFLDSGEWSTAEISQDEWDGWNLSLALDLTGVPYVSYQNQDEGDLRLAAPTGSAMNTLWSAFIVDTFDPVGGGALALDLGEIPNILLYKSDTMDTYLWKGCEQPLTYVLSSTGYLGWDLGYDSQGNYLFVFRNENEDPAYGTGANGSLTTNIIDPGSILEGGDIALSTDSTENILVAYETEDGIRFAKGTNGNWQLTDILDDPISHYLFIETDPADTTYLFFNGQDYYLSYKVYSQGSWSTTNIVPYSQDASGIDLTMDSQGYIHACYEDFDTGEYEYTSNSSGGWVTLVVAEDGRSDCKIAVDQNDQPYILLDSNLYERDGSQWIAIPLIPSSYVRKFLVDSAGVYHISASIDYAQYYMKWTP